MVCPECGCTEHLYFETKGVLLRKPLPGWVAVLLFVWSFILFHITIGLRDNDYSVIPGVAFFVCLIAGIVYSTIRKRRIEDDLHTKVMKRICKNCEHVEYLDI